MGQPIRGMARPLPVSAGIIPAAIPPEVVTLDANYNMSIHNRYDVEVIDSRTGKVKNKATAFNTVCAGMWDALVTKLYSAWFSKIAYGSGSGTPASSDAALFTFIGSKSASLVSSTWDATGNYFQTTKKMQLLETDNVGITITELGILNPDNGLCSHALLQDANGNAISILKTDTDIINIYATVFLHIGFSMTKSEDYIRMYNYDKNSYFGYLCGAAGMMYTNPAAIALSKTSSMYYNSTIESTVTYDLNAKKVTLTFPRVAASSSNIGGILWLNFNTRYYYNYSNSYYPLFSVRADSRWFTFREVTSEAIGTGDGTTVDFASDFDFPTNATVYVDGIADATAVVEKKAVTNSNGLYYFEQIGTDGNPTDSGVTFGGTTYFCYYNRAYLSGVQRFTTYGGPPTIYCSDDLANWVNVTLTPTSGSYYYYDIPSQYQKYKYWRLTVQPITCTGIANAYAITFASNTNIHFATAPIQGAVITMTYTPEVIAKDSNHVFDFAMTIQLGEYTS